ncbi:head-tail connector protein [Intestinibacillus massiliensis]|uniref:hypothetical protein n=1 Tax=Intestinibacillus massiliensis TaxID=1871029 RepID=UPI000B362B50|nr:hypothetical protein [Intestinibacillus massiliensis]
MAYADYAYYTGGYGGMMPETDFSRLSRRASAYLDRMTFGRAARPPEALAGKVRDACCAVADEMYRQAQGGEVAGVSNDGYRETYVPSGKTPDARLYAAAALYLGAAGLLYRGW